MEIVNEDEDENDLPEMNIDPGDENDLPEMGAKVENKLGLSCAKLRSSCG